MVWVQLFRKQVEETLKPSPMDAHGPLALSSSKLQAAKLAVPCYSVCTQSAWNDNESIHGKSRGEARTVDLLSSPLQVWIGGGVLSPMYNRAERRLQRGKRRQGKRMDEGGNAREGVWVAGGWERERERFHAE